jgi:hypothetical protein
LAGHVRSRPRASQRAELRWLADENTTYQQPEGPGAFHKKASERQSSGKGSGIMDCGRPKAVPVTAPRNSISNFDFRISPN